MTSQSQHQFLSNLKYRLITEDGEEVLTLDEYRNRPELGNIVGLAAASPRDRRVVFLGTTIVSFPTDLIEQDERRRSIVEEIEKEYASNPLKWFIPQDEDVRRFLNDGAIPESIKIFTAPNGVGKSVSGWVDILLDIVPCDPNWPIFKDHGVKWRRYKGPYTKGGVAIVTYEWENHITTIWPQIIKRWTPIESLGDYAETGKSVINWKSSPRIYIDGTPVYFRACSQAQTVFEAAAMDIYWWDEQGEEAKFDGANARVRRRHGRHTMTLTPHHVAGRPDTGAGSFIHKLWKGEQTSGLTVMKYHCGIGEIPPWIYTEEAKAAAKVEWEIEPTESGDIRKLREGRSRLYGEFHETSGLVFDEFDQSVHIIEPIPIKKSWTRYRSIDHGRIEPCAALCLAVTDKGDCIIYNEYYERDRSIDENCSGIIQACGNTRKKLGSFQDSYGRVYDRYDEIQSKDRYRWTVIDPRSAGKHLDDGTITIGKMYQIGGLNTRPGSGQPTNLMVPVVREYITIDNERTHIVTGKRGAPRVYIFSTCKDTIKEITEWAYEAVQRKDKKGRVSWQERPKALNDHLMMCLMMLCMENLVWVPSDEDETIDTQQDIQEDGYITRDPYCGY